MSAKFRIDVWSDIACPWCYIGKRRLEAALRDFPGRDQVELTWRSFELDPNAPKQPQGSHLQLLSKKYGASPADARAMLERVSSVGGQDGIDFDFERGQPCNTFDAHRLLHLARAHGLQDALKERLFRANFTEGVAIADHAELLRLATEVGLEPSVVRRVLESDEHALDVRVDQDEARQIGIRGVPFFVFGGRLAVSGAESSQVLLGALKEAHATASPAMYAEGAACGPEGC